MADALVRQHVRGSRDEVVRHVVGRGTYAVVAQALALGERYGRDPRSIIDLMNVSTDMSPDTPSLITRPAAGAEG